MKMKLMTGLLLALCAVLCCCLPAMAEHPPALYTELPAADTAQKNAEQFVSGEYTYTVENGEATIIAYEPGNNRYVERELRIPSQLDGYPVVAIGEEACSYAGLTSRIVIPEGVRTIGMKAFMCTSCTGEIYIPASAATLGTYAFSYVYGATGIVVADGNPNYVSVDGVLFTKDMTCLLNYPLGNTRTMYTVPESVTLLYCTSFADSTVDTLVVPSRTIRAMGYTFAYCTMTIYCRTSTTLYDQLTGEYPINFVDIQTKDYMDIPLALSLYPANVELVYPNDHSYYLYYMDYEDLQRPHLKWIATYERSGYGSRAELQWSSSDPEVVEVSQMGWLIPHKVGTATVTVQAVTGLNATCTVTVHGVTGIVTFPDGVGTIAANTFRGDASLECVIVPKTVTSIGSGAFASCTGLKYVTIGKETTSIAADAFSGSPNVKLLCYEGSYAVDYARANGVAYAVVGLENFWTGTEEYSD